MQSTYLSRSLFGCTRISLISAAVLVGTMVLPAKGTAQQTGNLQQSASTPEVSRHGRARGDAHVSA